MKSLQTKSKIRTISLILGCLIVLAASLAAAAYFFKLGPFSATPQNIQTEKEKKVGTDIKKQTIDNSSKGKQTGSDPSPSPTPIPNSNKSTVGADITSVNQDASLLHIRALVQAVTSSGTCTLAMTGPQQKTYSSSASVQALPSTSTCKGFDIPLSQLEKGDWKITITFNNDKLTASASKNITIQ